MLITLKKVIAKLVKVTFLFMISFFLQFNFKVVFQYLTFRSQCFSFLTFFHIILNFNIQNICARSKILTGVRTSESGNSSISLSGKNNQIAMTNNSIQECTYHLSMQSHIQQRPSMPQFSQPQVIMVNMSNYSYILSTQDNQAHRVIVRHIFKKQPHRQHISIANNPINFVGYSLRLPRSLVDITIYDG